MVEAVQKQARRWFKFMAITFLALTVGMALFAVCLTFFCGPMTEAKLKSVTSLWEFTKIFGGVFVGLFVGKVTP